MRECPPFRAMVNLVFFENESCGFMDNLTISSLYNLFRVDFVYIDGFGCVLGLLVLRGLS
jgi:hypothetical protein